MGAFPICLFGYTLSFSVPTFNAAGPQLNTPWQNLMAALRVHLSLPVTHLLTNNQNASENTCRRNGSVWKLHLSSDKMQYRAELSRDEEQCPQPSSSNDRAAPCSYTDTEKHHTRKLTLMGWEMQQGWELLGSGNVEGSSAYRSLWPHVNAYLDDLLISQKKIKRVKFPPDSKLIKNKMLVTVSDVKLSENCY